MSEGISFRSFVSETELDEKRKKRQEEWDKVRNEDEPEECPEEEYDPRCLYDRLQEQKDKKQEEYDEKHKFKNMIYNGLDNEEAEFLDKVSNRQLQIEKERMTEEKRVLLEYKESVTTLTEEKTPASTPKTVEKKPVSGGKKSQMALLAGAVKRKRSSSDDVPEKKTKSSEKPETSVIAETKQLSPKQTDTNSQHSPTKPSAATTAYIGGVLPGLGVYSESSDSDSSSSGSEIVVVSNIVCGLRK